MLGKNNAALFIVFSLIVFQGFSQKQNNQWRFGGRGGVDFNGASPVFVSGSAIQTFEGSASIADRTTGELLFYTDGVTVWNTQNQPMPNGTGLLGGTSSLLSSTTAAVIIPRPGVNNEYYVVTIDEQSSNNGIRYNVVNMNLDGGRGDIINGFKNIPIYQTTSEKLEVIPASDQQSYWLLSHDLPGNNFLAFKVTGSGIQTTPVISTVGGVQGNGSGHLKINRQFNKLAMGNLFDRTIELFDFNNSTGEVSNPIIWNFNAANPGTYGVEFSPNGKYLYVSNLEFVTQYNVSLSSATEIESSRFVLPSAGFNQPASLQLGPDNKIYINAGALDVINCPDNAGIDCGFLSNAIPNQTGGGGYGLPKWVFDNTDNTTLGSNEIRSSDTCIQYQISFTISGTEEILAVNWNFGDPGSGVGNTSTSLNPSHQFTIAGNYQVTAIVTTRCGNDTIFATKSIVDCSSTSLTTIDFEPDSCLQSAINFNINTNQRIERLISWNFDDPGSGMNNTSSLSAPSHVFTAAGNYNVNCILEINCTAPIDPNNPIITPCFYLDTIYRTISIVDCDSLSPKPCELFIPTAFSPNGDGMNDVYRTKSNCPIDRFEMLIYNRWGQQIFRSFNADNTWDGTFKGQRCPSGTYVYQVKYQLKSEEARLAQGTVLLIR